MRTQALLDQYCQALLDHYGDERKAARACGVSMLFIEQWAKDDHVTAAVMQQARAAGSKGLVSAAIDRAVHGVEKAVYFKGEVVGYETVYSDGLLTTLLKARGGGEFTSPDGGGGPSVTVNVANVMPRAENYEAWLAMVSQTKDHLETVAEQERLALTAIESTAVEVLDAEYSPTPIMPDLL